MGLLLARLRLSLRVLDDWRSRFMIPCIPRHHLIVTYLAVRSASSIDALESPAAADDESLEYVLVETRQLDRLNVVMLVNRLKILVASRAARYIALHDLNVGRRLLMVDLNELRKCVDVPQGSPSVGRARKTGFQTSIWQTRWAVLLTSVKPGEPLRIPAATFNSFIDAAEDSRRRQHDQLGGTQPVARKKGDITGFRAGGPPTETSNVPLSRASLAPIRNLLPAGG